MAHLDLVALVVRDYDPAIRFFVDVLNFELVEDTAAVATDGHAKRWVVIRPPGAKTGLLLARADGEGQEAVVGNQAAGRVGFFLRVDDFDAYFARMVAEGVTFVRPPRAEPYGQVAVFLDIAGNRWDLLGPPVVNADEQRQWMTELERLEEQLRLSFEGGAWHGPSVLEALADVSADEARAHPIANAHSIWELVGHLAGTYGLVLRRLEEDGRQLSPDEDWPALPPSTEEGWSEAIRELRRLNDELRRAVRRFPAERLDSPLVPEPSYSAYTQFIGVTQHNLYHAGQIVLLRKAMR